MPVSVTLDTLSAMTDKFFVRKLIDNVFLSCPLLYFLRENEVPVDGGSDIRVPIAHSKSTVAGRWAGGDKTIPVQMQEHATLAVFPIAQYAASMTAPKTELVKNMGRAKIVDLMAAQAELAEQTLRDNMCIDAYKTGATSESPDGVAGFHGLSHALTYGSDANGGYGGISRSGAFGSFKSPTGNAFWNANSIAANANTTRTFWRGDVAMDNSTVLTLAKMQAMFGIATDGAEKPDKIFTSQKLYNKYFALLTAIQRQMTDEKVGKAGFDSLVFNNTPVIVDPHIDDDGKMYFINSDSFEFKPFKDMNFYTTEFREAPNQLMPVKLIAWMGQMVCRKPRANSVLTALTDS